MSRRLGVTTGRVHHLFSDNESCFFLMADYSSDVVDIREQFPLFPEFATQQVATSLKIRHPRYPKSRMPIVMTTDFLLTRIDKAGKRSFMAFSIKSADDLCGRSRKSVLAKLEIEQRYWLGRGIPWYLFTNAEVDKTVIDNLEWLSYFVVEHDVDHHAFQAQLPQFLEAFNLPSLQGLTLADRLRKCSDALGATHSLEQATDMFRYCAWHKLINLDLRVPLGPRCVPIVLSSAAIPRCAFPQDGD
jgi:hypothetical protein